MPDGIWVGEGMGEIASVHARGARARALAAVVIVIVGIALARSVGTSPRESCRRPGAAPGDRARVLCDQPEDQGLPLGVRRVLGAPVDLNALTADDFESLPGLGPQLSRRIVAERVRRGGFTTVDDFATVKGVGPARLATLRAALEPPRP